MIFVDANIPMYARGGDHPYRVPCRRALERIVREQVACCTNTEVVQELLHRYLALDRLEEARLSSLHFMTLIPEVLPVTRATLLTAIDLIDELPGLSARDLLHVAVMRQHGLTEILSVDRHFDNVAGIRRIDPATWV